MLKNNDHFNIDRMKHPEENKKLAQFLKLSCFPIVGKYLSGCLISPSLTLASGKTSDMIDASVAGRCVLTVLPRINLFCAKVGEAQEKMCYQIISLKQETVSVIAELIRYSL